MKCRTKRCEAKANQDDLDNLLIDETILRIGIEIQITHFLITFQDSLFMFQLQILCNLPLIVDHDIWEAAGRGAFLRASRYF